MLVQLHRAVGSASCKSSRSRRCNAIAVPFARPGALAFPVAAAGGFFNVVAAFASRIAVSAAASTTRATRVLLLAVANAFGRVSFAAIASFLAALVGPFAGHSLSRYAQAMSCLARWRLAVMVSASSRSNYVSKPTAGDGLQSFRPLPAGSGLTRR